jgi:CRISPR-associated endonuclease/helicase Cas3
MEAGIDIDFPIGYRAMAGLDSIIQAAGRVNREGRRATGEICVFEPETPFIKRTPAFVGQGAAVSSSILRQFSDDPVTIEAIDGYFKLLYALQGEGAFDAKSISTCFEAGGVCFNFKTAAERFRLIDSDTVSVVIPYNDEAKQLIDELRAPHYTPYLATILRKLQRNLQMYTVNIYESEFRKLQSKGAIETYHERFHILSNIGLYDKQTGIDIPAEAGGDAIFIDV